MADGKAQTAARAASRQSGVLLVEQAKHCPPQSQAKGDTINFIWNQEGLQCRICKAKDVSRSESLEVMDLLETNMRALYEASSMGWDRKGKRRELFDKDSYLILLQAKAGSLVGFVNWRFDCEECDEDDEMARRGDDVVEVVYLYDLQMSKSHRGQRLGHLLMEMLDSIALKSHMRKVMLTVFLVNEGARRFYKNLGYVLDLISPSIEHDGSDDEAADYAILSKPIK
ncbi:hypothetical protein CBS101457_001573 [Exobasidium rhododendri]|nr:hypothetical protein CBS101457_001573 [Exobasidium rhododendri]